jgi:hypothetical protein
MPFSLSDLAHAWDQFFFAPTGARPVAQFRIAFGCILLYEAAFIARNFDAYLGPDGLVRYSSFVRQSAGRALSVFLYLPGTMRSARLIFSAHVVAVVCMTVGFLSPLSTLVAFVTVRSIVNRNPMIGNGGDNVAKIMCFLLIFTDPGGALSLDGVLWGHGPGPPVLQDPWALRLMQIQVSLIYVWTAYWKLGGRTYRNGTAVYYAVSNLAYQRWRLPQPLLRAPFVQAMTWGALGVEWAIGPALWVAEWRSYAALLGIGFHLTLEGLLNLHLFGWYMIACLLLFVDLATVI